MPSGKTLDAVVQALSAHPNSKAEDLVILAHAKRASIWRALNDLEEEGLLYPSYSRVGKTLQLARHPGVTVVCPECATIASHQLDLDKESVLVEGLAGILKASRAIGVAWNVMVEAYCRSCADAKSLPTSVLPAATSFFWGPRPYFSRFVIPWQSHERRPVFTGWLNEVNVNLNRLTWHKQKEEDRKAGPVEREAKPRVGRRKTRSAE